MTNTYPALTGQPVTQAHTNLCATRGHATHTVNGTDSGVCPRCGEVKHCCDTYGPHIHKDGWVRDRLGRWTREDEEN